MAPGLKFRRSTSKTSNTLLSTATAAGKPMERATSTSVHSGVGLAGLAANTAHMGAEMAMQGAGMAVQGAGAIVQTMSGGASSHGKRRQDGKPNEMFIFCSDLYTADFVSDEISKCKKNAQVDTLVIEDLLLRNDERLNKAAVNLVYKTALSPPDEFDMDDDEVLPQTPFERNWKSLTISQCITTAGDYRDYNIYKQEFQADLRKVLKRRGITKMPIKFTARVEIGMMDMNELIELLQEIENDKAILDVEFPDICKDIRKLPSALADHFDPDTLEWKEDAEPVEIHIKYGSKKPISRKASNKTKVVRHCSNKLEQIISAKCTGNDDRFAKRSSGGVGMAA